MDFGPKGEAPTYGWWSCFVFYMGIWGLLFVWVTQTRINTANYYLAMVNMQAFSRQALKFTAPRFVFAILVGVAVYALMMADIASKILQALAWQGVFIVAWVGVAVAHITCARGRAATQASVQQRVIAVWDWSGLASWVVGATAGVVCIYVPDLSAFSAPTSFGVALVAYRLMGLRGPKRLAGLETA